MAMHPGAAATPAGSKQPELRASRLSLTPCQPQVGKPEGCETLCLPLLSWAHQPTFSVSVFSSAKRDNTTEPKKVGIRDVLMM